MISKDKAKTIPFQDKFSNESFDEICSLCDKKIPSGSAVIRHDTTQNILCLMCLIEIAEIGG